MTHAIKAAVLSTCAVFLLAGAPALASPGGFGGWEPGAGLMHLVRKANLSTEQQAQIKSILASSRSQARALRQQSEAVRQQLADKLLATGSTPTLADFSALSQQMNQVHSQQVQLGLQTALQIRAVLTPAQVSRISQMHQQLANLNAQRQAVLQDDDITDVPAETEVR